MAKKRKAVTKRKAVKRRTPVPKATREAISALGTWLSCTFPTHHPVKVCWAEPSRPDRWGECIARPGARHIELRLKPKQSLDRAIDTLIHEWAHALTVMGLMPGEDPHSDRFYSVFGAIERACTNGGYMIALSAARSAF